MTVSEHNPQSNEPARTASGIPLKPTYGPDDVPERSRDLAASLPGQAPFHRGGWSEGYRTKPWRIFQLSGFGNPEDECERIKFLLERGETGFIMEHDRMTADHLYDVDHPDVLARREDVGLSGAVQLSARDTALVVDGIDQERYFAHPGGAVVQHAPFALAAYWTVAQRRGIPLQRLTGTGQSDFFLTYLGCITKEQIPARDGLKINADIIDFCAEHLPRWVPISIAAYNGADTGLNAYQELGSLLACAVEHLDVVVARKRHAVEEVARGVGGVNFRVGMDLFEDIAKLRAARRMWHDLLRSRYGISDTRALRMRIHIVTAGSAMTYQEPYNNIVRGTLMALASVLGGVQSLGVSGYDEALSIPSEQAHHMSVRIQQILMEETNITAVADPLGGSYYVETLTSDIERRAWEFFEAIQNEGGFIAAIDSGWLHARAAENQLEIERATTDGTRRVVGVNCHLVDEDPFEVDGFEGSSQVWDNAMLRLADLRRTRDGRTTLLRLADLEQVCRRGDNIMPAMLDAVAADASLGEIGHVFREVYGNWQVPIRF